MGVKLLALRSMNETRLRILASIYFNTDVVHNYLDHENSMMMKSPSSSKREPKPFKLDKVILEIDDSQFLPNEIAKQERICYPILPKILQRIFKGNEKSLTGIEYSLRPSESIQKMSLPQARLLQAFVQFQNKPYILLHSARNNHIEILLKESACMSNNCIEAFVAAGVYRKL